MEATILEAETAWEGCLAGRGGSGHRVGSGRPAGALCGARGRARGVDRLYARWGELTAKGEGR